jgi:hypothetical protein
MLDPICLLDKNGSRNQPAGPNLAPSHIYDPKRRVAWFPLLSASMPVKVLTISRMTFGITGLVVGARSSQKSDLPPHWGPGAIELN